jgi:Transglycosylase-like domain
MHNRFVAAGAALVGVVFVTTMPVAAGLGVDPDLAVPPHPERALTATSISEERLADEAHWMQVGAWVQAVQLGQLYEGIARAQAEAAAAAQHGSGGGSGDCLGSIRERESSGDYGAVSSSGTYRGAYQYDQQTWDSNAAASGRTDLVGADPAAVDPASQDQIAADTYARRGNQPWGGRC